MKPLEYLQYQLELEGIRRIESDLISRIVPNISDFPLILLAEMSDTQSLVCFDNLLAAELRERLRENCLEPFRTKLAIKILEESGIGAREKHFRTHSFPGNFLAEENDLVKCFSQDNPKVANFGFNGFEAKVFAVEQKGSIVSACVSARQNSNAAEAWVLTDPHHRRKGFAQQVVAAWAVDLVRQGIIPFYSHDVENFNSANLARKLGLIHIFDETVIEKIH